MADRDLSFWDYVKAAFHWKTALPLLGGMPLNILMLIGFGILGFGNPGFWLLGLALETGYLLLLAGNPRFQNLIKAMHLKEAQKTWSEREQDVLRRLDGNSRDRYQRLVERCRTVLQAEEMPGGARSLAGLKSEGLGQLIAIFLKLLDLRCRIIDTLAKTRREDIEADIKNLQGKISREPETSPVHRALKGTLDIQKTRLENLNKSQENLKFTETELERIEKQVSLIAEEAAVNKSPEQWSMT